MKNALVVGMALVSSLALADSHSEKKDAAAKKEPAKPAAGAPAVPTGQPPAEIAAMAKLMAGNWKCKGKGAMDAANPAASTEFTGTFKAGLDLDKFWIKGEWTGSAGKMKMRALSYMTYDAAAKKWTRIGLDNMGFSGSESSTGLPAGATEGKVVWEGDSRMAGMTMKQRTTEEIAAKSVKMTTEMSMDGKKWMTGMEMTCTK